MMPQLPTVLMCGPSREAISGVSTHLNQLFGSSIAHKYIVAHFQVGSEGRDEARWQKAIRLFSSPFALASTIIRHRVAIVHLNTSIDRKAYWRDLTYLIAAKFLRRKVVYQIHGGALPKAFVGRNRFFESFFRWTLSIPDIIVVLANIERDAYEAFKCGRAVVVIPNAIDLAEYHGMPAKDFHGSVLRLGFIGRLSPEKGIREIVEAISILKRSGIDSVHLQIAGAGPYKSQLLELLQSKSLDGSVELLGPVFDRAKYDFWRKTDLLVFPSYSEGLPYTVLEALASGTPVIATRVGAIPDVIEEGVHGLFVETRDSDSLANAICTVLNDRQTLRSMSRAAKERARSYYGLERLANQLDDLYQGLIK